MFLPAYVVIPEILASTEVICEEKPTLKHCDSWRIFIFQRGKKICFQSLDHRARKVGI